MTADPMARMFADDGLIPNNPRLPFLFYKGAVTERAGETAARAIEDLFTRNGWPAAWRNGVYPFAHYHATCHEALGIAAGNARVRFGGEQGLVVALAPGDIAVLPAGTGHQALEASDDLLVIGAYPEGAGYDLRRGIAREHAGAAELIAKVPVPVLDPLLGRDGGVAVLWRAA